IDLAERSPLRYGAIVRVLMLTGQRRVEVASMTWGELSEDLATWTIPAARTNNGIPHCVPLSQPTRELLRGSPARRARRSRSRIGARSWDSSSSASGERLLRLVES